MINDKYSKKISLLLIFAMTLCCALAAHARNSDPNDEPSSEMIQSNDANEMFRHEVSVGYGTPANVSLLLNFLGNLYNNYDRKESYTGPVFSKYFYHTSRVVGVGVSGIFSASTRSIAVAELLTVLPFCRL